MAGKTTQKRKKPVRRPLKTRVDEAAKKLERAKARMNDAQSSYDRIYGLYLRKEQAEKVAAIKVKFKKGKPLSEEETNILRTVL